jgi:mono/diheme cytochrome c family protein
MKHNNDSVAAAAIISLSAISLLVLEHRPVIAQDAPGLALVEQGKVIFETAGGVGCKTCHGAFGEGKVGPANRGVNEATIREALAKIAPMQFLRDQLADGDIKKVAAYTEWMGRHLLVKTLLKRGEFIPERVSVYPGTPIQLVIENTGTEPNSIRSDGIETAPLRIPARDMASIVWTAPADEGKFTIVCSDCRIKNGLLTIEVTNTAKPYVPPPQPKVAPKL